MKTTIFRDDRGKLWLVGRMAPLWLLLWDWFRFNVLGKPVIVKKNYLVIVKR